MTFQELGRLLKQHLIWFIVFPCLGAGAVYYFMRNEVKTYKTKATLYTGFTSGYRLNSAREGFQVDYSGISNAFDNVLTTLNSNQTLYQVGLRLLAQHLYLTKPTERQLSAASFQKLQQTIPASLRQSLTKTGNLDSTRNQLDRLAQSSTDNPVRALLAKSGNDYSAETISKKLKASRRAASDMLDMEYEADDPAIAQQTLDLAVTELNERYTSLKRGETAPVLTYYEANVKAAKQKLDQAESKLRAFNVAHNVLNFEDEIKTRSTTREALVDEYNKEVMATKGAKAAMDALNQRMSGGGNLLKINTQLTDKQAELTAAESQLINARTNGQPQSVLDAHQAKINQLSNELKQIAQNYFAADNTAESVPKLKLVNEWLDKVLEYEGAAARMDIVKKRLDEYQAESSAYPPLESEQRQLTRDLDVAEKEYLALVQSLNEAQTHNQDISLKGALSVLDPPVFPLTPQAPKKLLFMAIAAGAGLVIALLLAAFRAWADKRINSLSQAEQRLGSPIIALFPTVKKFAANSKASRAATSMFEQLANAINITIEQRSNPSYPPIITLFSTRSKQGKTWFAHGLARIYAESGEQVAYYYPQLTNTDQKFEQEGIHFFPYELHPNFMNVREPEDLLTGDDAMIVTRFDKIILELPPLVSSSIPLHLVGKSAVSLMVLTLHTLWGRRDKQLFALYLKAARQPVLVTLNKVEESNLDAPSLNDIKQGLPRTQNGPGIPGPSSKNPKLLNQ
ncbi:GumC family protein [Spirosoma aerolatum]|uniref:GumC family protein n=1 Tax=Spirosoma aerolatum TaxID=1211326 RepID=UPI0009AEBDAC|nr:GNVR domain-containing protein [Spirosoma aerolatum]